MLSHLSGLGTIGRNIFGNTAMQFVDTLATDGAGLVDMLVSKGTGTRSTAVEMPSSLKLAFRAAHSAYIDVACDIDTDASSKYDIREDVEGGARQTNRFGNPNRKSGKSNAVERFLAGWERTLNRWLVVPDEFFKGEIKGNQQRALNNLKVGQINEESTRTRTENGNWQTVSNEDMAERLATNLSLYRTFQNDSAMAKMTLGIQRALNNAGGIGYVLMPYAQVPGNLANVILEYSPLNAARGLVEIANLMINQARDSTRNRSYNATIADLFSNGERAQISTVEYQNKAVLNLSRGFVGTGLALLGYLGAMYGAISYDDDDNAAEVNISQIQRLITGGTDGDQTHDGDLMLSTSWLQPVNGMLTMGAAAQQEDEANGVRKWSNALKSGEMNAIASLADSPMFEAIYNIAQDIQYSEESGEAMQILDAVKQETISSISSALVPNPLRSIAKGTDNTQRNLYSGEFTLGNIAQNANAPTAVQNAASTIDSLIGEDEVSGAISNVMSTIPGLRQKLPEKVDEWGETKTYTDIGWLNMLNSAVTPWSVSKYKTTEQADEIARLTEEMSEDADYLITPSSSAPSTLSQDNVAYTLTFEERQSYQRTYGSTYAEQIARAMESEYYQNADADTQAAILATANKYAKYAAQAAYFGDEYDNSTYEKYQSFLDSGLTFAEYVKYDTMTEDMSKDIEQEITFLTDAVTNYGENDDQLWAIIQTFDGYSAEANDDGTITEDMLEDINNAYPTYLADGYMDILDSETFSGLDADTQEDVLDNLKSYAREKAKSSVSESYEVGSIVENVERLQSAGLDIVDYTQWKAVDEDENTEETEFLSQVFQKYRGHDNKIQAIVAVFDGYNATESSDGTITESMLDKVSENFVGYFTKAYQTYCQGSTSYAKLDAESQAAVLSNVRKYAQELAKASVSSSYEVGSIVGKVEALADAGLDMVAYTQWTDYKSSLTNNTGSVKCSLGVALATDSSLTTEQKEAIYEQIGGYDASDVDLSSEAAVVKTTASSETMYKRIVKYQQYTGQGWEEFYNLRSAVIDYCSANNLALSGAGVTKAMKKKNYLKTLNAVLGDFGYSTSAASKFYSILYE